METITISKHTLVVGVSFLVTFLIGICLGIAIGTHANYRNHMSRGMMMQGYTETKWGNGYDNRVIMMKGIPAQNIETTAGGTTTVK